MQTTDSAMPSRKRWYMAGVISSETPNCKCGGSWKVEMIKGNKVHVCSVCGEYPEKIRVRRVLPTKFGGDGKRYEIRRDRGERIVDVWDAIAVMKKIDKEIETNNFDPKNYGSRDILKTLQFSNFVETSYLPDYETMLINQEISPSSLKIKKGLYTNHLKKYFGDMDMRSITAGEIVRFYRSFKKTLRQRELATAELRVILKDAVSKDVLEGVPKFPALKKAKMKKVETFYTKAEQAQVVSKISNKKYQDAIKILIWHLLRPSDVRAIREKDVYLFEKVIKIRQHFSKGSQLLSGRKSNDAVHVLRIDDMTIELLTPYMTGNPDAPLFKGEEGGYMGEKVLAVAWKKAVAQTNLPYIDLYTGTKSSTMTYLRRAGFSVGQIMAMSGHLTEDAAERYAQVDDEMKMIEQDKLLAFRREG